jgi:hypothetical protein
VLARHVAVEGRGRAIEGLDSQLRRVLGVDE